MINPVPDKVIFCYGEWQPKFQEMKGVEFIEGFPDVEKWTDVWKRLVVIDDLMSETDDRVTKLFTKGSHHNDVSVMYKVQNLFGMNKEQRTISWNCHYIVVFKSSQDYVSGYANVSGSYVVRAR